MCLRKLPVLANVSRLVVDGLEIVEWWCQRLERFNLFWCEGSRASRLSTFRLPSSTKVYSVIYDCGSVTRKVIFSSRETSPIIQEISLKSAVWRSDGRSERCCPRRGKRWRVTTTGPSGAWRPRSSCDRPGGNPGANGSFLESQLPYKCCLPEVASV